MNSSNKNSNNKDRFLPFISADKILAEFTWTSVALGVLLSVVFGAANAYLGLKIGMTISASIPASVISMGIIRGILKRDSILENNMAQTIGSAGESLSAGAIFTLPGLFIWYDKWFSQNPSILTITFIALIGGILGVLFVIPLRKALIVKEHGVLSYPEGTACAEVLLAGEEGGNKAKTCFTGVGIGALYKFMADGFNLFPSRIETKIAGIRGTVFGCDAYPALLGVGFIIGPRTASYMLSGAILSWFVILPIIAKFAYMNTMIMFPASIPLNQLDHWGIWGNYIRYIGAGAVAFGGIISLIKSTPLIIETFFDAMKDYSEGIGGSHIVRTDKDIPMKVVFIGILLSLIAMIALPHLEIGLGGAVIVAIFGFFFATVSSKIVGLVGSSSNPVSGITIATLIITSFIFKMTGNDGQSGMVGILTIGAIICIITSLAGDTSQDLKTGFLVGATPYKQQYGEIIGVIAASLTIGFVLTLFSNVWGFGSNALPAPQATLMHLVIEGVIGGNLPWGLIFVGAAIGVVVEIFGLPILPIAIGIYLPIHLSVPVMIGGIIRGIVDKQADISEYDGDKVKVNTGILYSSGLIAGEGIIGIILAIMSWYNINANTGFNFGQAGAVVFFIMIIISTLFYSVFYREAEK